MLKIYGVSIPPIYRKFDLFIFFYMLLSLLLVIPLIGIFIISTCLSYDTSALNNKRIKTTGLITSVVNLLSH